MSEKVSLHKFVDEILCLADKTLGTAEELEAKRTDSGRLVTVSQTNREYLEDLLQSRDVPISSEDEFESNKDQFKGICRQILKAVTELCNRCAPYTKRADRLKSFRAEVITKINRTTGMNIPI